MGARSVISARWFGPGSRLPARLYRAPQEPVTITFQMVLDTYELLQRNCVDPAAMAVVASPAGEVTLRRHTPLTGQLTSLFGMTVYTSTKLPPDVQFYVAPEKDVRRWIALGLI